MKSRAREEGVLDGKQCQSELPGQTPSVGLGFPPNDEGQVCAMEAAAWLAGEKWSDDPKTVHRAIRWVARSVNDEVSDDVRQTLWPLVLASLDTSRPGHLLLSWRLGRYGRKLMADVSRRGDFPRAWQKVLDEHARLYGEHPRPSLLKSRLQSLVTHVERG